MRVPGQFLLLALLPSMTTGCGLTVPNMPWPAEGIKESNLVGHIKCELHLAVQNALAQDAQDRVDSPNLPHPDISWLKKWGAQVSLKITVDERSNLTPGINLVSPMANVVNTFPIGGNVTSPQSFSLGLGASITADSTRTETIGFYYYFPDLLAERPDKPLTAEECKASGPILIESDLKIDEFFKNKILMAENPGLLSSRVPDAPPNEPGAPFNAFTYEVAFIVTSLASLTPTWKLVRVSTNPAGNFLGTQRIRTDDLTITMGAAKTNKATNTLEPSTAANNASLAAQIGQAVATAIRSQTQTP